MKAIYRTHQCAINSMLMVMLIVLSIAPKTSKSQTVTDGYTNSWFTLLNRSQLNKKWSVSNEFHERTGKFLETQGQFLFRPSIDYHLNNQVEFTLGYTFIHLSPYKPYATPIPKNENNLWEQITLKNSIGKVRFLHRFRQENRWINHIGSYNGEFKVNGNDYSNRFRYRFVLNADLFKLKESKQSVFIAAWDEIWFLQNNHLTPTDFNRNWVYLGVGYAFNPTSNIQVGYMHQYDKIGTNSFISTPILQMTLVKNFNFFKE
jgi:hypothetical protein